MPAKAKMLILTRNIHIGLPLVGHQSFTLDYEDYNSDYEVISRTPNFHSKLAYKYT